MNKEAEARMFLGRGEEKSDDDYDYDYRFFPYFDDGFGHPETGGPHFMDRDSDDGLFQDDDFSSQQSRFSLVDFFENLFNLRSRS